MLEGSLMDLVIMTVGVILTMGLLSCLCCLCMKISDLKMKKYILETAKMKGIQVDLELMGPKQQSPLTNDNCTIMVPEVGIIL